METCKKPNAAGSLVTLAKGDWVKNRKGQKWYVNDKVGDWGSASVELKRVGANGIETMFHRIRLKTGADNNTQAVAMAIADKWMQNPYDSRRLR